MGRCGIACKELYNHPERKNSTCFALPPPLVERAFLLGQQGGALQRLQKRLACAKARRTHVKLSIVAAGGSVTAGPGGKSWANHMFQWLGSHPLPSTHRPYLTFLNGKLSANGVGPSYFSGCWDHHAAVWNGTTVPDLVFLEYAINDMRDASTVDIEALIRRLAAQGTIVVLLHHFTPAFMAHGNGYRGISTTAEWKHARVATHYGLSTISFGEAVGLSQTSTPWRRANARPGRTAAHRSAIDDPRDWTDAMLHPCAFQCAFTEDNMHPTVCGQKMIAELSIHALQRLLLLDEPWDERTVKGWDACNEVRTTGPCQLLPPPLSWHDQGSDHQYRCESTRPTPCWSNVGARETWNLWPLRKRGFKLINLKAGGGELAKGVVKMLWQGRIRGSFAEFEVRCPSQTYLGVRLMYLQETKFLNYGLARVEIDDAKVATLSGHRSKGGTLFISQDLAFPAKCKGLFCRRRDADTHIVRITILDPSDAPEEAARYHVSHLGFGVNAIMCMRTLKPETAYQ